MAITAALVEATTDRLRYLLTQDGAGGTTLSISAATLATDAQSGPPGGAGPALLQIVATAAASQAEARRLFCGEQSSASTNLAHVLRAHLSVTSRDAPTGPYFVDADAAAGFPNISVKGPSVASNAYLDLTVQHTTRPVE